MRSRYVVLALLCNIAACKGSIEGSVYGTDDAQSVRLSSRPVFLLATSVEVAAVLKSVCPANAADWIERARSERSRFEQTATAYSDSTRDELALHRGSRRWSILLHMMNVYRDSARGMDGRPPSIPSDLVEKLAMNRATTSSNGHFTFGDVAPGRYLLATEIRDEYRWVPVEVARAKTTADITPRRSQTSCDVARGL
jgi:hypothetical protein